MVKYAGIFLFGVFISSAAQVLLKKSAMKKYGTVWQEYLNPLVIGAYFLLSMGPVLEASGYLYVTYFGVKIYKEKISMQRVAALAFMVAGIFVYTFWG